MSLSLFQQLIEPSALNEQWVEISEDLFVAAGVLSLIWFIVSLILCKTVFQAFANALSTPLEPLAVHLSEGLTYVLFIASAWAVIPYTDCFQNHSLCFADNELTVVRLDITLLYCIQMAGYLNMLLMRFAIPRLYGPESPDLTLDTVIHHVVTLLLLTGSWMTSFTSIGCIVFLLHDPSSVWLKVTRIAERVQWTKAKERGFLMFALCFFIFRILGMPLLVGRPTFVYGPPTNAQRVLSFLLCTLYTLNVVWFSKIVQILLRPRSKASAETKLLDTTPASQPALVV